MLSGMQVTQRLLLSTSSNSSYISLWRRRASAMWLWRHCESGKQLFLLQHQTVHNHQCLPFQWLREAKGNHPNHGGGPQHLAVCPNENHLFAQQGLTVTPGGNSRVMAAKKRRKDDRPLMEGWSKQIRCTEDLGLRGIFQTTGVREQDEKHLLEDPEKEEHFTAASSTFDPTSHSQRVPMVKVFLPAYHLILTSSSPSIITSTSFWYTEWQN